MPSLPEPCFQIGLFLIGRKGRNTFIPHLGGEGNQLLKGDGTKCAEHEQRAMGEVHNPERAKDQRQAQRNQRIGRPFVQSVQDLNKNGIHEIYPVIPIERIPELPPGKKAG